MSAYLRQQIARRSRRARERVAKRWEKVRAERRLLERIALADPLRMPFRILRRVIVVEADGVTAHEIIRFACDSERSWRRKLAEHGLTTSRRRPA